MKKVRFESRETVNMNDSDCHSPRPFLEKRLSIENTGPCYDHTKPLMFSMDPVHRFETSNSSPYPIMKRTNLDDSVNLGSKWSPSSDLELSMLDATCHEPRRPLTNYVLFQPTLPTQLHNTEKVINYCDSVLLKCAKPSILASVENTRNCKPESTNGNNSFFITKGNLHKFQMHHFNNLNKKVNSLSLDKENNPASKTLEIQKMGTQEPTVNEKPISLNSSPRTNNYDCSCHHCVRSIPTCNVHNTHSNHICQCMPPLPVNCNCNQCILQVTHKINPVCRNANNDYNTNVQNTVDKKTWAIEKYEQSKNPHCTELQKQTSVKEKREPTVTDLFKIIKLQNEQLQLLQEKVDKFTSTSNSRPPSIPIQSYTSEHVALETGNSEQHKISIGVMTSFEMVRTSTVINKEVVKQMENSQIQCNRSQISIKEVVSKTPIHLNFLDGIAPVGTNMQGSGESNAKSRAQNGNYEEKTFNELSLCNVQVDNATTPLMSPEQTLYLDVRDYSDSDPDSDQSNVGWTYYNKVMTHVNGMLQDSDMPSSASALYRNTRQQCLQMQIDKTNVSVTKRVKFGDDPLGIRQPHIYAPATDTSIKMDQLAAKYLKTAPPLQPPPPPQPVAAKQSAPFDMSFATRNYMERHKLLQGPGLTKEHVPAEIPRFLDITALKQQPKLL